MCVSKKETKEYPMKVTKKKIESSHSPEGNMKARKRLKILQKDERMKFVSLV
jgi:hypothetical protein